MTEPTQEEIISIVYSIFDVKDMLVNPEDLQFKIDGNNFKDKFVSLARQLEFRNRVARLEKSSDEMFIFVTKLPQMKRKWLSKAWVPRILFAVTVAMV